jgi:hypothetical protein
MSELLIKLRQAVLTAALPELDPNDMPPVPDLNNFELPPVRPGNNCNRNDKAIFVDLNRESGLVITICSFLEFEVTGKLSANDLFKLVVDKFIDLKLDSSFTLKGALSTGFRIKVTSIEEWPVIELDPIIAQLDMQSDLSGSVSLGVFGAAVAGDAALRGQLKLGYCEHCEGTYPEEGYTRVADSLPFLYFSRLIGYNLEGRLDMGLSNGMIGVTLAEATLLISDDDVFDDTPPVFVFDGAHALEDIMNFSPQNAISKSTVVLSQPSLFDIKMSFNPII